MFFRLSLRVFVIGMLVLSSLWLLLGFVPILYSIVYPPRDLEAIVRALEVRGTAPPQAAAIVQQTIASAGTLRRGVRIGYHVEASATLNVKSSHSSKTTQVAYVAWFQNLSKPILLLIERSETDGVFQSYGIGEGAPMSLVGAYAYPLIAFGVSLFLVRRYGRRKVGPTPN
jgi:hypothetical protein